MIKNGVVIRTITRCIGIWLFGFVLLSAVREGTIHGSMTSASLAFITGLLGVLVIILLYVPGNWEPDVRTTRLVLMGIFLLTIASRLAWILLVPTIPVSDFEVYHNLALNILSGHVPAKPDKPLGYPLILAAVYSITQHDVLAAKATNIVIATIEGLAIFRLGEIIGGRLVGLIAAGLFAIWPSDVTMTSVLNSDIWAATFITIGLLATLGSEQRQGRWTIKTFMFFSGFFLGAATAVRPASAVFVPIALSMVMGRTNFGQRIVHAGTFAVGFTAVLGAIVLWHSASVHQISLNAIKHKDAAYLLLAGTNLAARGMWNEPDALLYYSWPEELRTRLAIIQAYERIRQYRGDILYLIFEKIEILLGNDMHGVYWSSFIQDHFSVENLATPAMYVISQAYYIFILANIMLCFAIDNKQYDTVRYLGISSVLLTVAIFSFLEVQGRYHHVLIPIMAIMAATGISQIRLMQH